MFESVVRLPRSGDRVKARIRLNWDVDEFEDFPTTIMPGERGTVTEVVEADRVVYVMWDADEHPHKRKSVFVEGDPSDWPIEVVG